MNSNAIQKIGTASTLRKVLLICGILSSLVYVGTDILAGMLWEGYSFTSQFISELSAIGAPTRPMVVPLFLAYAVLKVAFGLGVWVIAGRRRALRLIGGLLAGEEVVSLVAPLFPMNLREAEMTFTDTMHLVITAVTVLLILLSIGLGAVAYGKRFRFYSIGTLVTLLMLGSLSFSGGAQLAAEQATPWVGVMERITVYGYMLWVAVLAIVLLRGGR
jgi:hypothetical protein